MSKPATKDAKDTKATKATDKSKRLKHLSGVDAQKRKQRRQTAKAAVERRETNSDYVEVYLHGFEPGQKLFSSLITDAVRTHEKTGVAILTFGGLGKQEAISVPIGFRINEDGFFSFSFLVALPFCSPFLPSTLFFWLCFSPTFFLGLYSFLLFY